MLMVSAETRVGEAAAQSSLARGVLTEACGEDAAHDALVDICGVEAGAFDGGADGDGAEVDGGEIGERALKFADGRSCGTDDDDITHEISVLSNPE